MPFGTEYYADDYNYQESNHSSGTLAPFGKRFYNHSHELFPYESHIGIPKISGENVINYEKGEDDVIHDTTSAHDVDYEDQIEGEF